MDDDKIVDWWSSKCVLKPYGDQELLRKELRECYDESVEVRVKKTYRQIPKGAKLEKAGESSHS